MWQLQKAVPGVMRPYDKTVAKPDSAVFYGSREFGFYDFFAVGRSLAPTAAEYRSLQSKISLERHHKVARFTVEVAEPFGAHGGVVALVEQVVAVQGHRPGVVDTVANSPVPDGIACLGNVVAADG